MDLAIVLIVIALVLAFISLFFPPRAFQLLAASVILIAIALLLGGDVNIG